eukprot:2301120-Lingulodinium_polyedra.AAC.1
MWLNVRFATAARAQHARAMKWNARGACVRAAVFRVESAPKQHPSNFQAAPKQHPSSANQRAP